MVKSCCVAGCTANKAKYPDRQFYIIPQESARRTKWKIAINRGVLNAEGKVNKIQLWSPRSSHNYVCSAHFITGAKVNDPRHPDYVPSIFPKEGKGYDGRGSSTTSCKIDRYKRRAKRSNSISEAPSAARKRLKMNDPTVKLSEENDPPVKLSEENDPLKDVTNLSPGSQNQTQLPLETPQKDQDLDIEPETPLQTVDDEMPGYATARLSDTPMQAPMTQSEREMLYTELTNVRRERDEALQKIESLEKLVNATSLTSTAVEGNNELCKMLTGVSWDVFMKIFVFLCTFLGKTTSCPSLPVREQLFVTLIKLRHNLSFEFLAQVKGIPKSTMIDYFWKWIDLLHAKLTFMVHWQDRENIFQTIPTVFKEKFPRLTSIVDCFEIFIEAPRNLLARAQCYSNYKKHCTIKFFISCSPLGSINFLSKAWGGRASDVHIVRESGFIDSKYHLPGDQILADRGFTLYDDFAANCSAELLTPAFTKGKKQLSAREVEISRKISSVRIHIERVIGLLKNRYTILKGSLPVRCVQSLKDETLESTLSSCDKIISVCAALTNMGPSIIFKDTVDKSKTQQ